MIIEKKQQDKKSFVFNWSYFESARVGLKYILQLNSLTNKTILLPAYIGFSTREGSGVFDPIREVKIKYVFYKLDKNLSIDVEDLEAKMMENQGHILLLIHYFGFMDDNMTLIKEYAAVHNMVVVEDYAHAFFTFWNNPVVDFDYGIFSIHKLFPANSGGIVLSREKLETIYQNNYNLFSYDINTICKKRIKNYNFVLTELEKYAEKHNIILLRCDLKGHVPQTFPILLKDRKTRDTLYFSLNEMGYGVVSLYHTLIDEIDDSFFAEHDISQRILNLPIHQDAEIKDLGCMIKAMIEIIS